MKINFTETVLRDANQSLVATRMTLEELEPVFEKINKAGYYSVECWGGATFDSCLRFLDEDPWVRLQTMREKMPDAKLQMLLRGQNLLGYKHYPDDVVRKFVQKSVENGIDIIRIFDALNDTRNIRVALEETIKCGATASAAISFTTSPVHSLENYVKTIKELESMGADSICIKDMAGIMTPLQVFNLVKAIKESVNLPVIVHTHCTAGLAYMTCLKAAEAGADIIDTAVSCFSGGTSQPATETMFYALDEMGFKTDLKIDKVKEINDYLLPTRNEYLQNGLLDPMVLTTDSDCLNYQLPGGMLSNLISQLKAHNRLDSFNEVLEETPKVRKDLGYPPLVTPMSQMVGVQAVQNVLSGERYKNVGSEIRSYLKGEYGRAPGEIDEEIREMILGGEEPVKGRFAETLPPLFEKTKAELGGKARSDEDVLSYIAFPSVAEKFFENRLKKEENFASYTIEPID